MKDILSLKKISKSRHFWLQNGNSKQTVKCVTCGLERTFYNGKYTFYRNNKEVVNEGCKQEGNEIFN